MFKNSGHLTSTVISPLRSLLLNPKLYSTAKNRRLAPCNKVTSPLSSLLPSHVSDRISEVPLYFVSIRSLSNRTTVCIQFTLPGRKVSTKNVSSCNTTMSSIDGSAAE